MTRELLTEVTADVPDEWLVDEPGFDSTDAVRRAYVDALLPRAAGIHERITMEAEVRPRSGPPGWLAERLAPPRAKTEPDEKKSDSE